uniref:3-dehydroquinate synthase n=1 Tax=Fulvivirga sp. TaxID=1931237 RepID=UPI00404A3B2A
MLEVFEIKSSEINYEVQVGSGQLTEGALMQSADFLLVDENIQRLWPHVLVGDSLIIQAAESNKTLAKSAQLIEELRNFGANRSSTLIAYGGGIIQDLATFTASIYMRGISWSYVPTTLLGMVDSCIGGKSSINVGPFKNIAGNYHPPQKILIDIRFCRTLARIDLLGGLCEAAKICFAAKGPKFNIYLEHFVKPSYFLTEPQLLNIVLLSLLTKKDFIEEDEFDVGPRLLLNFGHTFGHAIEAGTQFSIPHGVSVGFGMLAEIKLSRSLGIFSKTPIRVEQLIKHINFLLNQAPEMIHRIGALDTAIALRAFKSDKKHQNNNFTIILPDSEGFLGSTLVPISAEIDQTLLEIFKWLKSDLKKDLTHEI